MGKYPKILSVLTLVFFVAQASALDIWGGSNNAIGSYWDGASTAGGLIIGPNTNELNYDLFSYSQVPAGSTGFAYSDWEIPNTQITTGSYTNPVDGISHDLAVLYRGHVQTGVKKDSAPADPADPDGDSYANAHVTAVAGVEPFTSKAVYGSSNIQADLWLAGKSEGYAIANGLAGYSSAAKVTGTSNDYTKVEGAASGEANLNGLGGVYFEKPANDVWAYTNAFGISQIYSAAEMIDPGIVPYPWNTRADSYISTWGNIDYATPLDPPGTNQKNVDGSTSLDMSATGSANAKAWGGNSPVIKTDANANSLADIDDVNIESILETYKYGDSVYTGGSVGTSSNLFDGANANLHTYADAYRERADEKHQATAESFINGGEYNAAWKPVNNFGLATVSGAIGWDGYLPGMASGAHLVNDLDYRVHSESDLDQTAALAVGIAAPRTAAVYTTYTYGPEYTGTNDDDAGSFFATTGYTTTSTVFDTYSTSVASYYDINWVAGEQISTPSYGPEATFTETPEYSALYDAWSESDWDRGTGARWNDAGKIVTQTVGT